MRPALLPWLFTAYVMWSPWHYTGQNFGLLMMFMRRAGVPIDERQRRRLRLAFVASYVMLLAAFNEAAPAIRWCSRCICPSGWRSPSRPWRW